MIDFKRVHQLMGDNGLDAMIVNSPQNVFYFSGFLYNYPAGNRIFYLLRHIGPAFVIVPRDERAILVAPSSAVATAARSCFLEDRELYNVASGSEYELLEVAALQSSANFLGKVFADRNLKQGKIGVEGLALPVSFREMLQAELPDAEFLDATRVISDIRIIKSAYEIERLHQAAQTASRCLQETIKGISEGMTENDIIREFKAKTLQAGGEWCNTKVAAGPNSTTISHQPSDYQVRNGDLILFDVGAVYAGYTSDIARVTALGTWPERAEETYAILRQAHQVVLDAVKPGIRVSELFDLGVQSVRDLGLVQYARKNIGHGVGVDFEEEPFLAPNNHRTLEENMVLAIELPLYDREVGGFNIEDVVLVTSSGARVLS